MPSATKICKSTHTPHVVTVRTHTLISQETAEQGSWLGWGSECPLAGQSWTQLSDYYSLTHLLTGQQDRLRLKDKWVNSVRPAQRQEAEGHALASPCREHLR